MSSLIPVSGAAFTGMAATALLIVLTPGPNMMYLASRSISQGRTAGLISLIGTGLGFLTYMVMANVGLAVVFVAVPWLYIGLKAAGIVYLAYLTFQALRPGGRSLFEVTTLRRDPPGRLLRMGLVTNLLNPKTAILYLTLIPQFVDPSRGHTVIQGLILGSVQIVLSLSVNASIVVAAGGISSFLRHRPRWTQAQRLVTGGLLGTVTLLLVRELPQRARA